MNKTKFVGLRMEKDFEEIIEHMVREEHVDKTTAIKMLVKAGWKEIRMRKTLEQYQKGLISVDKAAAVLGITVNEMMRHIASQGIRSEETLEEFRRGLRILSGR